MTFSRLICDSMSRIRENSKRQLRFQLPFSSGYIGAQFGSDSIVRYFRPEKSTAIQYLLKHTTVDVQKYYYYNYKMYLFSFRFLIRLATTMFFRKS